MQLWSFVLTSPTEVFLNILSLGCYFQPIFLKIPFPDFEGIVAKSDYNGARGAISPFIFYVLELFFASTIISSSCWSLNDSCSQYGVQATF